MISLAQYLRPLAARTTEPAQRAWLDRLGAGVAAGQAILDTTAPEQRRRLAEAFGRRVRTEELKAWYGEPEQDSLFQGTSISALTIPGRFERPLDLSGGIEALEQAMAEEYIRLHDAHAPAVRAAILEPVDRWLAEGLFFGIVVSSKMLTQAFGLTVDRREVIFPVDGVPIDPHEITSHPEPVRDAYFTQARDRIGCFADLPVSRTELEQSLVLADISKPRIEAYRDRLMLGPVRCNEICAVLARRLTQRIRETSRGRIAPRSLMITLYDTDTPYTYHTVSGYGNDETAPVLPGLTVLGASGSIDAFRWLYAYRTSLVAQKIQKSSLWSQVAGRFHPFVFFGVLVERDAEILLDLDRLDLLRYPGMLSPAIEYAYLLPALAAGAAQHDAPRAADELAGRLSSLLP